MGTRPDPANTIAILERYDWTQIERQINEQGWAFLPKLLTASACRNHRWQL